SAALTSRTRSNSGPTLAAGRSASVTWCSRGATSTCPLNTGLASRNATTSASASTMSAARSPAMILQNTQSLTGETLGPLRRGFRKRPWLLGRTAGRYRAGRGSGRQAARGGLRRPAGAGRSGQRVAPVPRLPDRADRPSPAPRVRAGDRYGRPPRRGGRDAGAVRRHLRDQSPGAVLAAQRGRPGGP